MKKTIRLRESELRQMISESVRKTLNEDSMEPTTPVYMDILDLGIWVEKAYDEYTRGVADSKTGSRAMNHLMYLCNKYVEDYNEAVNDGTISPYM